MINIYLLTDYKGYFGAKQKSEQYKSGMNKSLLREYFMSFGFNPIFVSFTEINFRKDNFKNEFVIYTSSEDAGYHYKDFIEDIILGLELQGAKLIPKFMFLRANNNKVFMEILRDLSMKESLFNIKSLYFGTVEKLKEEINNCKYPAVIKTAQGAMSKGVFLAKNQKDLLQYAKKISRTRYLWSELWNLKNYIKYQGRMILNSKFRKKFIVQNFVPKLKNDWKVLVYKEKLFVLNRSIRKNDFRASGSGEFSFEENLPDGLLDFAYSAAEIFDLPQISLDIAFNGKDFILIEFQAIYFGTKAIEYAPFYFKKHNGIWNIFKEKSILEKVYAESICNYIKESLR